MTNNATNNKYLPQLTQNIANWHHDRNLIEGATHKAQAKKMLEELTELYAAVYAEEISDSEILLRKLNADLHSLFLDGRIKTVAPDEAKEALQDALGDMAVVAINHAEREGISYETCLDSAYQEIKDRKGKMIDGVFVKESDL